MRRTFSTSFHILRFLSLMGAGLTCSPQEPDRASKIYADASKSVLLLLVRSEQGEVIGQGTGFVVQGGKVVTNEHVVRNGRVVIDLGAVRLPVTVERIDAFNDLALLTAGAEVAVKALSFADATPTPGTAVFAIGNPAGLERTISTGVVSAVREFNGREMLQITAPISPGSSGGPILNGRGEVVGVAVGMLKKGQNLNFAVPISLVRNLISGKLEPKTSVLSQLEKVEELIQQRSEVEFSSDPKSKWQQLDQQVDKLLESAFEGAGDDSEMLLKIAKQAELESPDIAIAAAERADRAKPTADGQLIIGKALKWKALFSDKAEKGALQERAEKAMRTAHRLAKQPSAEMHYDLGDLLEDRGSYEEAETNFRRALDLGKGSADAQLRDNSIRGLVRTTYSQGKKVETDTWFKSLVDTGNANAWDWARNGRRMDEAGKYSEAGQSYRKAALLGGDWANWCEAAGSFFATGDDHDAVLASARKCVAEGTGKEDSESRLAQANKLIAEVLNERGVYQEALSHAREATTLDPSDAWAFDTQAKALIGLRRFQEAINAGTQAVRLSDGKFSTMHFNLGSAYFKVENWEFARQSYEKASQLDPIDSAAPYNVALCMARLGFYRDAASWYEEVLRRDPNHRNRQDILNQIQRLRQ